MASRLFSEFFFIRIIVLVPYPTRVGFLKRARGIFLRLLSVATIEVKYNDAITFINDRLFFYQSVRQSVSQSVSDRLFFTMLQNRRQAAQTEGNIYDGPT